MMLWHYKLFYFWSSWTSNILASYNASEFSLFQRWEWVQASHLTNIKGALSPIEASFATT